MQCNSGKKDYTKETLCVKMSLSNQHKTQNEIDNPLADAVDFNYDLYQ